MGDLGSIPGLGRSTGEGKGNPLQYSGLENSMDCIVHGVTESDTTEWLSLTHSGERQKVLLNWEGLDCLWLKNIHIPKWNVLGWLVLKSCTRILQEIISLVETWKIHSNLNHLLSADYILSTFRALFLLIVTFSEPRGPQGHFFKLVAVSRFLPSICEIKMQQDLCIDASCPEDSSKSHHPNGLNSLPINGYVEFFSVHPCVFLKLLKISVVVPTSLWEAVICICISGIIWTSLI